MWWFTLFFLAAYTVVSTYVYNYFHFMSIYVYECMIDFVCSNLYLICVATHVYNDLFFTTFVLYVW